jgi:hypothetical protein
MGPAMVLTTGILLLFQSMGIAELDRTWPAWILVVGIVKLLQSSASSDGHVGPLPGAPPAVAPPQPPPSNPGVPDQGAPSQGPTSSSGEVRHV